MSHKILVTGGLGYVGGRVAQAIADKTDHLLLVTTRKEGLSRPEWLSRGEIVTVDPLSDADMEAACEGVSHVVHFNAVNENDCVKDPQQALAVNTMGVLKMVQAAQKAGVQRFIYFSTGHIYKAPIQGTITEEDVPRPTHPYAITHQAAEHFVLAANEPGKFCGVVFRLSNGFGFPVRAGVDRWTLVANDLCRQAVIEKKLVLRSAGLQRRDFIPLSDVGRAVLHFLDLPNEACGDGLFNLGGENPMRIIDITERIASRCQAILGFTPEIVLPEPSPKEASQDLHFSIDRLKQTGFRLEGSVDDEIDETLRRCQTWFNPSE